MRTAPMCCGSKDAVSARVVTVGRPETEEKLYRRFVREKNFKKEANETMSGDMLWVLRKHIFLPTTIRGKEHWRFTHEEGRRRRKRPAWLGTKRY